MNPIQIKLTEKERDLILEHTLAEADLTKPLKLAELQGNSLIVKYALEDLDELAEHIAAEANHAEDPKLQKRLDRLFDKLNRVAEKHSD